MANTAQSTTYSGDNYPGHPHHEAADSATLLGRSINDLAYVLNEQDGLMAKLGRALQPADPVVCGNADFTAPKSEIRNDIDGQAARVRKTNSRLKDYLSRIEL